MIRQALLGQIGLWLLVTGMAAAQPAQMTEDQQAWFYCAVSKKWCVASSADKSAHEEKLVAMISANKPAYINGHLSRVTLQVACSSGEPVTMLMTGREIKSGDITLRYRISPSGKTGTVTATEASAGYFFAIQSKSFIGDLRGGDKASFELNGSSDVKSSKLEYDLAGMDAALKRLDCF